MFYDFFDTVIGRLMIAGDESGLRHIDFEHSRYPTSIVSDWIRNTNKLLEVREQLRAYFDGKLHEFTLRLNPYGTPFQLGVWEQLRKIPYGETVSYGELAQRLGNSKASRAVGAANGRNPLPIVVPCHRVIGSNGSMTGFGGGIDVKRRLLALESRHGKLWPENCFNKNNIH